MVFTSSILGHALDLEVTAISEKLALWFIMQASDFRRLYRARVAV